MDQYKEIKVADCKEDCLPWMAIVQKEGPRVKGEEKERFANQTLNTNWELSSPLSVVKTKHRLVTLKKQKKNKILFVLKWYLL